MAETYNKLLVDVNAEVVDIITAVQDDTNSRYLDVVLYNNGVPIDLTGHEVRIYLRKPETGQEVWNDGEITDAVNGRCQFLMTTQALAEIGYLKAQISIWKDNTEILSTQIFNILVTESLRTTGSIESSNEYGALVVIFQNFYQAMDLMTTMVQNIGVPAEVAAQYDLATMWQAWEFLVAYMKGDLTTLINQALANASVQGVLDILGLTGDTGGSTTAGTTMAKLNAVLLQQEHGSTSINYVQESANVLFTLVNSSVYSNSTSSIYRFTCGISGSIRIVFSGYTTQNYLKLTTSVLNRDTGTSTKKQLAATTIADTSEKTYTQVVYINVGDILEVVVESDASHNGYCSLLVIGGTIVNSDTPIVAV